MNLMDSELAKWDVTQVHKPSEMAEQDIIKFQNKEGIAEMLGCSNCWKNQSVDTTRS